MSVEQGSVRGFSLWERALLFLGGLLVPLATSLWWMRVDELPAFWDRRSYLTLVRAVSAAFESSIGSGVAMLAGLTDEDYNGYFVVPLLPWLDGAQTSLDRYVLGLLLLFVPGFLAACHFVGRYSVGEHGNRGAAVIWLALAMSPFAWAVSLGGLPDAFAGGLLAAALLSFLRATERPGMGPLVAGGLLLGGTVALRRHFAYPALASIVAIVVMWSYQWWRSRGGATTRSFFVLLSRLAVVGFASLAALLLLVPDFVSRATGTDYGIVYSGYAASPAQVLAYALQLGGWVLLAIGAIGWVAAWRRRPDARIRLALIGLMLATWMGIWVLKVRFTNVHYFFAIWTLFLAVGLWGVASAVESWRPRARTGANVLIVTLALFAFLSTLFPARVWRDRLDPSIAGISAWPAPYGPQQDVADSYRGLVQCISDEVETRPATIVLTASSATLNRDLLLSVAEETSHAIGITYLAAPEVDSRDPSPLSALAAADAIVTAQPFQHHLRPDAQRVVQLPNEAFLGNPALRASYRVACTHELPGGVTAQVHVRTRPLSGAIFRELIDVARGTGKPINSWVLQQDGFEWAAVEEATSEPVLFGNAGTSPRPTIFMHTTPLPAGVVAVNLQVQLLNEQCKQIFVQPALLPVDESAAQIALGVRSINSDGAWRESVEVTRPSYLQLRIHTGSPDVASMAGCGVRLKPSVERVGLGVTPSLQGTAVMPEIVSATYGANCIADGTRSRTDVTDAVAAYCSYAMSLEGCPFLVDASRIGDPAVGCAKDFHAAWRCGDETFTGALEPEAHGRTLMLGCRTSG